MYVSVCLCVSVSLTTAVGHTAGLPSLGAVGGVAPGPVGIVVWVPAVVGLQVGGGVGVRSDTGNNQMTWGIYS